MVDSVTVLKLNSKASMIITFDIDVPSQVRQDIAREFSETCGLPTMVIDKHVSITIIEPKEKL